MVKPFKIVGNKEPIIVGRFVFMLIIDSLYSKLK